MSLGCSRINTYMIMKVIFMIFDQCPTGHLLIMFHLIRLMPTPLYRQWTYYSGNSYQSLWLGYIFTIWMVFRVLYCSSKLSISCYSHSISFCRRASLASKDLYDHFHPIGDGSILNGYMIHSHQLPPGDLMHNFRHLSLENWENLGLFQSWWCLCT